MNWEEISQRLKEFGDKIATWTRVGLKATAKNPKITLVATGVLLVFIVFFTANRVSVQVNRPLAATPTPTSSQLPPIGAPLSGTVTPSPTVTATATLSPLASPSGATPTPLPSGAVGATTLEIRLSDINSGAQGGQFVNAKPGDTMDIAIVLNIPAGASSAQVKYKMPTSLVYVAGTTTLDGVAIGNGIVGANGIALGALSAGTPHTVHFQADLAVAQAFPYGMSILTMLATATTDGGSVNTAGFIQVQRDQLVVIDSDSFSLGVKQQGRNITQGDATPPNVVRVFPGDIIEFTSRLTSVAGTALNNVIVKDTIPFGFTYVTGSATVNGVPASGSLFDAQGVKIASVRSQQDAVIVFRAKAGASNLFTKGSTATTNTIQATATGLAPVIAQTALEILNGTVGQAALIPTGAEYSAGTIAMAFAVLMTLAYMFYTGTELFRYREVEKFIDRQRKGKEPMDFR